MRSEEEILEALKEEKEMLRRQKARGEDDDVQKGWVEALQYVLGE